MHYETKTLIIQKEANKMTSVRRIMQESRKYSFAIDSFLSSLDSKEWRDIHSKPSLEFFNHDKEYAEFLKQQRIAFPQMTRDQIDSYFHRRYDEHVRMQYKQAFAKYCKSHREPYDMEERNRRAREMAIKNEERRAARRSNKSAQKKQEKRQKKLTPRELEEKYNRLMYVPPLPAEKSTTERQTYW